MIVDVREQCGLHASACRHVSVLCLRVGATQQRARDAGRAAALPSICVCAHACVQQLRSRWRHDPDHRQRKKTQPLLLLRRDNTAEAAAGAGRPGARKHEQATPPSATRPHDGSHARQDQPPNACDQQKAMQEHGARVQITDAGIDVGWPRPAAAACMSHAHAHTQRCAHAGAAAAAAAAAAHARAHAILSKQLQRLPSA